MQEGHEAERSKFVHMGEQVRRNVPSEDYQRKYRSALLVFSLLLAAPLLGQDTKYHPQGGQIPGAENPTAASVHCCATGSERPLSDSAIQAWLADVRHWRMEHLIRIGFNDAQYSRPEFQWAQQSSV